MNDTGIESADTAGRYIPCTIVLLAMAFRVVLAVVSDNVNHPDEVFQILEQSHRVVFGYGMVPWEFRYLHDKEDVVAVYDASTRWFRGGGFYYLHRNVPLYFGSMPPPTPEHISHILTWGKLYGVEGFYLDRNFGKINVYARADSAFQYKTDSAYTSDMIQYGVDDQFSLKAGH
jgi:hypothetical protein